MVRRTRSNDWGFPRWRSYGDTSRAATAQRTCDHAGCQLPGLCPAPKAPDRPERWWFCEAHAAEYNRGWNYFDALSDEEAAACQAADARAQSGYARARHWQWNRGDGSRSSAELDALEVFGLPPDASEQAIKTAWRQIAKAHHPDLNPDNADSAQQFRRAQAAYEVLCKAEDRRREAGS